jgi:hypothetical protein
VQKVIHSIKQPNEDLGLLSQLLERLEREPMSSPRLAELHRVLLTEGISPAQHIARLRRLVHLLDARRNQFFAPISPVLLWATHCAFAIEKWRASVGPALGPWLAAIAEIEVLSAFAAYSFEHPDDPFPELSGASPRFDGEQLGHPLLPGSRCVRNDVYLEPRTRGAHRQWLQHVGQEHPAAHRRDQRSPGARRRAGASAPTATVVALGGRVDSRAGLTAGWRVALLCRDHALTAARRHRPDFPASPFFLDEILHGTNSHDRLIGAEAIVRGLVEAGAIGLVTTHDLALSHIVESPDLHAANVHFADHMENGHMVFDYRMQPGVVQKSNALELMRAVGLKVPSGRPE